MIQEEEDFIKSQDEIIRLTNNQEIIRIANNAKDYISKIDKNKQNNKEQQRKVWSEIYYYQKQIRFDKIIVIATVILAFGVVFDYIYRLADVNLSLKDLGLINLSVIGSYKLIGFLIIAAFLILLYYIFSKK